MTTPKEGPSQGPPPLHTAIDLTDILSLTDFQRAAKQHISRLRRTGKAQVLTVNGAAALVVQDAKGYQRLLDEITSLRETLATRTTLVAARVEAPTTAPAARAPREGSPGQAPAPKREAPTNSLSQPEVATPPATVATTASDERANQAPQATPATAGLARALAQLRQQLAGEKRE
jgi:hypothetical protein